MPQPRKLTVEQRADIVLRYLSGAPAADLCRQHQLSSTTLHRWREEFVQAGTQGLEQGGAKRADDGLAEEARQLRGLVGELALANYALKGGPAWTRSAGGRR